MKMKSTSKLSIFIVAAFVVIAVLMSSCMEPCVEGNGTIRKENRVVDNFSNVVLSGDCDVFISQGTTTSVSVEADENLLPYLLTENRSSGTLEIRNVNNRCLRSTSRIKVTITTPNIYKVTNAGSGYIGCDYVYNSHFEIVLSGSGEVDCYKLDTENLKLTLSGSGMITLQGKTISSDMLISGSGKIKAYDMDQDDCYLNITGSGDAYVFVFDYLKVSIPGSGNVFFRGNPNLDYRIDGSGRVVDNNK